MICLSGSSRDAVVTDLGAAAAAATQDTEGLRLGALGFQLDAELATAIFTFCEACPKGHSLALRLAHNDLSSGTSQEHRIFELRKERDLLETEKTWHEKKKQDSGKEKDFAVAASKKREATAGIEHCTTRIAEIDEEMGTLEEHLRFFPWYVFVSRWESRMTNNIMLLDLSDCCLHATALKDLTNALLTLEQRAVGEKVRRLILDGNDIGDIGMAALTSYLRLTDSLEALHLRNVGITDRGLSELVAGLVKNRSLKLLDLRSNGLCDMEMGQAVLTGVKHFNKTVEIWFP